MKLIIDISEKVYSALIHTKFDANLVVDEMRKAIANGKPLDGELQEIRQEIKDSAIEWYFGRLDGESEEVLVLDDVLKIIDTHISALNNDQFERIWQNTVKEMKRRKIDE